MRFFDIYISPLLRPSPSRSQSFVPQTSGFFGTSSIHDPTSRSGLYPFCSSDGDFKFPNESRGVLAARSIRTKYLSDGEMGARGTSILPGPPTLTSSQSILPDKLTWSRACVHRCVFASASHNMARPRNIKVEEQLADPRNAYVVVLGYAHLRAAFFISSLLFF